MINTLIKIFFCNSKKKLDTTFCFFFLKKNYFPSNTWTSLAPWDLASERRPLVANQRAAPGRKGWCPLLLWNLKSERSPGGVLEVLSWRMSDSKEESKGDVDVMSSNFPFPPRPPQSLPCRSSHLLNSSSSLRQWIEHLLRAWPRSQHWGQMSFALMELAVSVRETQ